MNCKHCGKPIRQIGPGENFVSTLIGDWIHAGKPEIFGCVGNPTWAEAPDPPIEHAPFKTTAFPSLIPDTSKCAEWASLAMEVADGLCDRKSRPEHWQGYFGAAMISIVKFYERSKA